MNVLVLFFQSLSMVNFLSLSLIFKTVSELFIIYLFFFSNKKLLELPDKGGLYEHEIVKIHNKQNNICILIFFMRNKTIT